MGHRSFKHKEKRVGRKKVKLDAELHKKAANYARKAGYASVDEFIEHVVQKEIAKIEELGASAEQVEKQLRGLGYIA